MKDNKYKFSKPTAEELDQTAKLLLKKYDVVIPKLELVNIVNLIKELGQGVEYNNVVLLSKKIRAILVTYMPIPRNESVEDKIKKLFELQYAIDLTQNQTEQIAQYLTRVLWYEDGLDKSLDNCLDDLLTYTDKIKRGKRTNGINSHNKLRQTLDEAIGKLNISSTSWER